MLPDRVGVELPVPHQGGIVALELLGGELLQRGIPQQGDDVALDHVVVGVDGGDGPAEPDHVVHPLGEPLGQGQGAGPHHLPPVPGHLMQLQRRPGLFERTERPIGLDLPAGIRIPAKFQCHVVAFSHVVVGDIALFFLSRHPLSPYAISSVSPRNRSSAA